MPTVLVCTFTYRTQPYTDNYSIELAVSLNSNDAQILTRQGSEWVSTVTLSEVKLCLLFEGEEALIYAF